MARSATDIEKDRVVAATIEGTFERYAKLGSLHAEATAETFKHPPDGDGNISTYGYQWWQVAAAVRDDFVEAVDEMSRIIVDPT
jgi:hypothetical protein